MEEALYSFERQPRAGRDVILSIDYSVALSAIVHIQHFYDAKWRDKSPKYPPYPRRPLRETGVELEGHPRFLFVSTCRDDDLTCDLTTLNFAELKRSIMLGKMKFERQVAGPKRMMCIIVRRGRLAIRLSFQLHILNSGDETLASST